MSSYNRLFKSSTANAFGLVVRIVQQLSLVTILVSVWPPEVYGEWLLVSSLPIFIALADFGFVLTLTPGNLGFESAPFKLIEEYEELLDGKGSYFHNYF